MYLDLDFSLMEMNPFTLDAQGKPFPLDMRGELDDTASFRRWGCREAQAGFLQYFFCGGHAVQTAGAGLAGFARGACKSMLAMRSRKCLQG